MKLIRFSILIVVVLLITIFFRHQIAASFLKRSLEKETGLTVQTSGVYFGALNSELNIEKIEFFNPPTNKVRRAILIEDFQCQYRLKDLFKGRTHIIKSNLKLIEMNVVSSKDGTLNLTKLHQWIKNMLDKNELSIEHLTLSVHMIHYIDEAHPEREPLHFECKKDAEEFSKIESSKDLDQIIQTLILKNSLNNLGTIFKGGLQKLGDFFE